MARRIRRIHAPAFKAKVALAAIKGEKTLAELAQQYDVEVVPENWFSRNLRAACRRLGSISR